MDFLGLTNFFLIETGVSDQVRSLEDVNDDVAQAAHWINTSWASFQRERLWPFRKAEGSFTVEPGTTSSTPSSRSMSTGDLIISNSFYSSLGGITQVSYEQLREKRRAGAATDTSRVTHLAVRNGTIESYPDIVVEQDIEFDYWRTVQALVNNTDEPYGLPADFHALIGHLAVARYGVLAGGAEGANLYNHHGREFMKALAEYERFIGIDTANTPAVANTLLSR